MLDGLGGILGFSARFTGGGTDFALPTGEGSRSGCDTCPERSWAGVGVVARNGRGGLCHEADFGAMSEASRVKDDQCPPAEAAVELREGGRGAGESTVKLGRACEAALMFNDKGRPYRGGPGERLRLVPTGRPLDAALDGALSVAPHGDRERGRSRDARVAYCDDSVSCGLSNRGALSRGVLGVLEGCLEERCSKCDRRDETGLCR